MRYLAKTRGDEGVKSGHGSSPSPPHAAPPPGPRTRRPGAEEAGERYPVIARARRGGELHAFRPSTRWCESSQVLGGLAGGGSARPDLPSSSSSSGSGSSRGHAVTTTTTTAAAQGSHRRFGCGTHGSSIAAPRRMPRRAAWPRSPLVSLRQPAAEVRGASGMAWHGLAWPGLAWPRQHAAPAACRPGGIQAAQGRGRSEAGAGAEPLFVRRLQGEAEERLRRGGRRLSSRGGSLWPPHVGSEPRRRRSSGGGMLVGTTERVPPASGGPASPVRRQAVGRAPARGGSRGSKPQSERSAT
eukprot:scaffold1291_cov412-Prasinococcus_capsulatus_cf.AAC.6